MPDMDAMDYEEPDPLKQVYIQQELDKFIGRGVMTPTLQKLSNDLINCARYCIQDRNARISYAFVASGLDTIQKAGSGNAYLKALENVVREYCAKQMKTLISGAAVSPLKLLEDMWGVFDDTLDFLVEYFCPQAHEGIHPEQQLRTAAKKIFAETVLGSKSFHELVQVQDEPIPRSMSTKIFSARLLHACRIMNQVDNGFYESYIFQLTVQYCALANDLIPNGISAKRMSFLVFMWLKHEAGVANGLGFSTEQLENLTSVLNNNMVMGYLTEALRRGASFDELLEKNDYAAFHLVYDLYQRCEGGLSTLLSLIRSYIDRKSAVLEGKRNKCDKIQLPVMTIKDLMAFKMTMDFVQSEACNGDATFQSQLQAELHRAFGAVDKFAEFLALYLDIELRGRRGDNLDKVMGLVHYVDCKEDFEKIFRAYLARRLIGVNGFDPALEKYVVEKLKDEFGAAYTRRMEKMFKDIDNSRNAAIEFSNAGNANRRLIDGFVRQNGSDLDFNITILTPGFWPQISFQPTPIKLPQTMITALQEFELFYRSKYATRKLVMSPFHGFSVVQASFYGFPALEAVRRQVAEVKSFTKIMTRLNEPIYRQPKGVPRVSKQLIVTPVQTAILSLFNTHAFIDAKVIKEIDIPRAMLSLIKNKVILRDRAGEEEIFYVNDGFLHRKHSVNLTKDQKAERTGKKADMITREAEVCRHLLEAAVVRIMKTSRSSSHHNLRERVTVEVRRQFDDATFKKCVENLIDQGYIKRKEKILDQYDYID